ncbi:MAG TPA: DUF4153 domain-containing protein, partial [Gemmatimonadales bacterium]|nr:DUF4153 domain-containing protein [Gemmatimonadales bacterium]
VFAVAPLADETWVNLAFAAALGLPAATAATLVGEVRRWPAAVRLAAPGLVILALALFFRIWPGIDIKHEAIRYVQLSAVLHLAVAFLPFLGEPETRAFWQYNRRLFLGFLRSVVFSGVLFVGIAVALVALDRLFGIDIDERLYPRIWFVMAFVVNTWIFLSVVPDDLAALADDTEYPKVLRVFAQYILTPLVFVYLLILLAYLVKLIVGGEWPSGWIGWLVTSVAVTGLLGFLLVYPLRSSPGEAWIRTYARWLFIGLIPAAIMLLIAFWKRIEPYGMTEPRVLGIVLGGWLLGIALTFTVRPDTSIRRIPMFLAAVLLLTLYGPLSLTRISVASQRDRLQEALRTAATSDADAREAGAALRFLMDHRAGSAIAAAVGKELPPIRWDGLSRYGTERDSVARRILALAGAPYVPEYAGPGPEGSFHLGADRGATTPVGGFDWMIRVSSHDTTVKTAGSEPVQVRYDTATAVALARIGPDTVRFELLPLVERTMDSVPVGRGVRAELLRADALPGSRRARLMLESVSGSRIGDSAVRIRYWDGSLLVGPPSR